MEFIILLAVINSEKTNTYLYSDIQAYACNRRTYWMLPVKVFLYSWHMREKERRHTQTSKTPKLSIKLQKNETKWRRICFCVNIFIDVCILLFFYLYHIHTVDNDAQYLMLVPLLSSSGRHNRYYDNFFFFAYLLLWWCRFGYTLATRKISRWFGWRWSAVSLFK